MKKRVLTVILCLLVMTVFTGCSAGLISASAVANNGLTAETVNGYTTFTKITGKDFKILQLTDIHLGNGWLSITNDRRAQEAVIKLVESTKPDLIILTGDNVYPIGLQSGSTNNLAALKVVAGLMESFEIPWTLVFGNHDTEKESVYDKEDLCDYLESNELKHCLFDRGFCDTKNSKGNYVININNPGGKLNTSLFLMDSNMYADDTTYSSNYDNIHEEQVDWYEEQITALSEFELLSENVTVPSSLAFMHIPVTEYEDAWRLYKKGSDLVTYHYGTVKEPNENICDPAERSTIFSKMVSLGSTKGIFSGHDHLNDFSITYQGIRLTYGKSIDYLAYLNITNKHEQRGGTVIEIADDASFEIIPVILADI